MLLAATPDPVVNCGTTNATWTDLAHRIQEQAGVPLVLIDGSLARLSREIRAMPDLPRDFSFHLRLESGPSKGRMMKPTIRTEEQIIGILQEHEAGAKCADLCRKHGMSEGTFHAWKAKYSGMTVSEAKRMKALEGENPKLKKLLGSGPIDFRLAA